LDFFSVWTVLEILSEKANGIGGANTIWGAAICDRFLHSAADSVLY
jgi:hypothetical protein